MFTINTLYCALRPSERFTSIVAMVAMVAKARQCRRLVVLSIILCLSFTSACSEKSDRLASSAISESPAAEEAISAGNAKGEELGVVIELAQMRELAGAQSSGAVYLRVRNQSAKSITIVGGETPIAEMVEVHQTSYDEGMMRMRPVESITVAAGETFDFTPRSHHFMLMGIVKPPAPGSEFPLTISLADGSSIETAIEVKPLR